MKQQHKMSIQQFMTTFISKNTIFKKQDQKQLLDKLKSFNNINAFEQIFQKQQYLNRKIHKDIYCKYNKDQICKLICIQKRCRNYAFICEKQEYEQQSNKIINKCQCYKNHKNCKIIILQNFLAKIQDKINQPIKDISFKLCIELKSFIVNYMIQQISKQLKQFQDWLESLQSKQQSLSYLYLFGFKKNGYINSNCYQRKILNNNNIKDYHKNCNCLPIISKTFYLQNISNQQNKKLMRGIRSNYIKVIDFLQQIREQIQSIESFSYNLNFAEYQIFKFISNINQNINQDFQEQRKKINGNLVYFAYKLKNQKFNNLFSNINSKNQIIITGRFGLTQRCFLSYQQTNKDQFIGLNTFQDIRNMWIKFYDKFNLFVKGSCVIYKDLFVLKDNLLKQQGQLQAKSGLQQLKIIWLSLNGFQIIFGQKMKKINIPLSKFNEKYLQVYSKINLSTPNQIFYYCHNNKSQKLRNAMKKILFICAKSKNTKFLYYLKFSDVSLLKNYYEDQQFMRESDITEQDYLTTKQILQLSQMNNNLQNIHIPNIQNKKALNILKNLKKVKHIAFGISKLNNSKHNQNLLQYLNSKQFKYLQSITIFGVFNISSFISTFKNIISNNSSIKTITIDGWKDYLAESSVLKQISLSIPKIENLIIRYSRSQGDLNNLSQLSELKILDLSCSYYVSSPTFVNMLKNKKKLTHIKFTKNQWLYLSNVQYILNLCTQLQMLNIKKTMVESPNLLYLAQAHKLKCLIFANNINYLQEFSQIQKFSKLCPQIQRLSIRREKNNNNQYIQKYLLNVMMNCKNMTHLNVFNNKICKEQQSQQEFFSQFKNLKKIIKNANDKNK